MSTFYALILATAGVAEARCAGTNLFESLSPAQQAEVDARADAVAYGEGIVWEVSRNGRRSTLFGTIHISDPTVSIPPVVSQRIAKADQVFLEIVADDEARMETEMMSNPALVTLVDGPGLREQLTATEWARLTELLTPLGLPEVAMDRMRPWLLSILIALPMCELLAVQEGGITLDRRVEMLANASGVPVGGLESAAAALAAVQPLTEEGELQ